MRNDMASFIGCLMLATISPLYAGSVDAKLLDMLLKNGSITTAQHAELSADMKREQRAATRASRETVKEKDFIALQQLAGWASTTKLTGDMRVRNDIINIEDEPSRSGREKDRQRVRARFAVISQINPQVEAGIQIASGNADDRRSTNQDLDRVFDKKLVWMDLAYIDFHPIAVPGLKLLGGKMKQPWMSFGDAMWDGDINPEGFAASYTRKKGTTTLFGSGGYYVLKDNVDGEGVEFSNDLALYALQLGTSFDVGRNARLTFGGSLNDFNNDKSAFTDTRFRTNGNTTDRFSLYEMFGQLDVIGLPLPLSLYGQYIVNSDARDLGAVTDGGEDTAWLFGLRTNVAGVAFDYSYRDVEANAVVGGFTDSDFASGYTNSSGHKLKAQYDFLKNFNLTVSYFLTESDAASRFDLDDASVNTLMIDLNAKF